MIPWKGVLKKAAGGLVTLVTGTASTKKQRGTIYVLLSLAIAGALVKWGGLTAEDANAIAAAALEYLPQ